MGGDRAGDRGGVGGRARRRDLDAGRLPHLPRALQGERRRGDQGGRARAARAASSSTASAARTAPASSSAFLLDLAGVATEDIAADYALSEERLRPRHEAWFAAAETEEELERLRRIAQTPAESMVGVFAELERRYGSVEGYLRSAGVSDEELALAAGRLRG